MEYCSATPKRGGHHAARENWRDPTRGERAPSVQDVNKEVEKQRRELKELADTQLHMLEIREAQVRGYHIRRGVLLGQGSYAKVRLAVVTAEKMLSQPRVRYLISRAGCDKVAVKVINKKNASSSYCKKFLPREMNAMMNLPYHPNVVQLYESFETDTNHYLVLEYMDHGNLVDYIANYPLAPPKWKGPGLTEDHARTLFKQICHGLLHCHHSGIVHRDLKCENILLDKNYNANLSDFGFCCIVSNKRRRLGTACGSFSYSPPELLLGKKYSGFLADIWSLGIVLFVMLNGAEPYKEDTRQMMVEVMKRQRLKFLRPLSFEAMQIIRRILQFDPLCRPQIREILMDPWMVGEKVTRSRPVLSMTHASHGAGDINWPSLHGLSSKNATSKRAGDWTSVTLNVKCQEHVTLRSRTSHRENNLYKATKGFHGKTGPTIPREPRPHVIEYPKRKGTPEEPSQNQVDKPLCCECRQQRSRELADEININQTKENHSSSESIPSNDKTGKKSQGEKAEETNPGVPAFSVIGKCVRPVDNEKEFIIHGYKNACDRNFKMQEFTEESGVIQALPDCDKNQVGIENHGVNDESFHNQPANEYNCEIIKAEKEEPTFEDAVRNPELIDNKDEEDNVQIDEDVIQEDHEVDGEPTAAAATVDASPASTHEEDAEGDDAPEMEKQHEAEEHWEEASSASPCCTSSAAESHSISYDGTPEPLESGQTVKHDSSKDEKQVTEKTNVTSSLPNQQPKEVHQTVCRDTEWIQGDCNTENLTKQKDFKPTCIYCQVESCKEQALLTIEYCEEQKSKVLQCDAELKKLAAEEKPCEREMCETPVCETQNTEGETREPRPPVTQCGSENFERCSGYQQPEVCSCGDIMGAVNDRKCPSVFKVRNSVPNNYRVCAETSKRCPARDPRAVHPLKTNSTTAAVEGDFHSLVRQDTCQSEVEIKRHIQEKDVSQNNISVNHPVSCHVNRPLNYTIDQTVPDVQDPGLDELSMTVNPMSRCSSTLISRTATPTTTAPNNSPVAVLPEEEEERASPCIVSPSLEQEVDINIPASPTQTKSDELGESESTHTRLPPLLNRVGPDAPRPSPRLIVQPLRTRPDPLAAKEIVPRVLKERLMQRKKYIKISNMHPVSSMPIAPHAMWQEGYIHKTTSDFLNHRAMQQRVPGSRDVTFGDLLRLNMKLPPVNPKAASSFGNNPNPAEGQVIEGTVTPGGGRRHLSINVADLTSTVLPDVVDSTHHSDALMPHKSILSVFISRHKSM